MILPHDLHSFNLTSFEAKTVEILHLLHNFEAKTVGITTLFTEFQSQSCGISTFFPFPHSLKTKL